MKKRYELIICEDKTPESLLAIEEISLFVDIHPEYLKRFIVLGLIDPLIDRPEPLFAPDVIPRIKKIERLRNDLGINLSGIGLILDLLERISQLEKELHFYRNRRQP